MPRTDIFIVGVGGQGSLSASWFLGEAANRADLNVLVGEVHGMAQRGGVVESTVRIGDVHGPIISDGAADVLLGFEPVETLRFLHKASPGALVITNTHQVVPANVSMRGDPYPELERVLAMIRARCARVVALDATELARQAGSAKALNAVMLGALSASGTLPMGADVVEAALLDGVPAQVVDINVRAFAAGAAAIPVSIHGPDSAL
jgi:indolepyruvate ferredoxin oxidoreductase beta subunit